MAADLADLSDCSYKALLVIDQMLTLRHGAGTQSNTPLSCALTSASTRCTISPTCSSASNEYTDRQSAGSGKKLTLTIFRIGVQVTIP
jgi:hypothetical protein